MKAIELARRYYDNEKAVNNATEYLKETEPTEDEIKAFVGSNAEYISLCSGRFSAKVEKALMAGSNPMSVWEDVMEQEEYFDIVENHVEWLTEIECKYAILEEDAQNANSLRKATSEALKVLSLKSRAIWDKIQELRVSVDFKIFLAELARLDSDMAKTLKNRIWQNDQD